MHPTQDRAAHGDLFSERSWYALHTRHQHEKAVAQLLWNKRFEVFVPLYTAYHRWKDRTKELSLPLFPCYVFLRGSLERRIDIVTTPGVIALIASAGRPLPVPDAEIEAVQRLVARNMLVEPHPFLKCGDWVRVKCGPLEGIEGILIRKKNLFKLVLSVELLQQSVAVEVDVCAVERSRPSGAGIKTAFPVRRKLQFTAPCQR